MSSAISVGDSPSGWLEAVRRSEKVVVPQSLASHFGFEVHIAWGAKPLEIQTLALRLTIKPRSQGFSVNRCDDCALFADVSLSAAKEKARRTVRDVGGGNLEHWALRLSAGGERAGSPDAKLQHR